MNFPIYKVQRLILHNKDLPIKVISRKQNDPRKMSTRNKLDRLRDEMLGYFIGEDVRTGASRVFSLLESLGRNDPKTLVPLLNKMIPDMLESKDRTQQGSAPIILNMPQIVNNASPQEEIVVEVPSQQSLPSLPARDPTKIRNITNNQNKNTVAERVGECPPLYGEDTNILDQLGIEEKNP